MSMEKWKPSAMMIDETLSHYEILSQLGRGGMGVVYKARDRRLLRTVALKVLEISSTTEWLKGRFLQEARAASALNHPGIVGVYDVGSDQSCDFLAMEYVRGQSLAERMDEDRLTWSETIDYAIQIVDAVAAAHAAGVVHRDLKPQNIMITEAGQIKILDFGIAKLDPATYLEAGVHAIETISTAQGQVLGTAAYMSPEQTMGQPVDARSDIFSFGIVLYEMLTGEQPFGGGNDSSLLKRLHFDTPRSPTALRKGLPPAIDRIVQTALAKNPQDRQQSMAQLKRELQRVADETGRTHHGAAAALDTRLSRRFGRPKWDSLLSGVFMGMARRPGASLICGVILVAGLAAAITAGLNRTFQQQEPPVSLNPLEQTVALDLDRVSPSTGLSRAVLQQRLGCQDTDQLSRALQTAQRAIELEDQRRVDRLLLGLALLNRGYRAEAGADVEQATGAPPQIVDKRSIQGDRSKWSADLEQTTCPGGKPIRCPQTEPSTKAAGECCPMVEALWAL